MMPPVNQEILVVGGGPAGASAALAAARNGASTLLIEKRPAIGYKPHCAEFVPLPLALESEIPREVVAQPVLGMETIVGRQAVFTQAPGLMIDRPRFDALLAARSVEAGAEVCVRHCLTAWDEAGVLIRSPGGVQRHRPALVIAADGAASCLGRILGLGPPSRLTGVQLKAPLRTPLDKTKVYFTPAWRHGYAWLFPKDELANIGLGMRETTPGQAWRALHDLLSDLVCQDLVEDKIVSKSVGAIPVSGPKSRLTLPGPTCPVLFVGDSAGLTHPITGAGIPQAVISGREAGEAAARYLLSRDWCDLVSYEETILSRFGRSLSWAGLKRTVIEQEWHGFDFRRLIERTWPAFKAWRKP